MKQIGTLFLGVTTHQLDILKQQLCLTYQSQIVFQCITDWFGKQKIKKKIQFRSLSQYVLFDIKCYAEVLEIALCYYSSSPVRNYYISL